MNIIDRDLILRAIEIEDKDILKKLINDPDVEAMVVGWSFPVSTDRQINWITEINDEKTAVRFIIETKSLGVVGLSSLTNIDFKNGTATVSVKLLNKKEIRNKGIAFRTGLNLIEYAFYQLNLNCLVVNILEYNIASQKLFEKCGFKNEGTLRNRIYKNGNYHNLKSLSLLRSDYN